jgi:hypothetical protein
VRRRSLSREEIGSTAARRIEPSAEATQQYSLSSARDFDYRAGFKAIKTAVNRSAGRLASIGGSDWRAHIADFRGPFPFDPPPAIVGRRKRQG